MFIFPFKYQHYGITISITFAQQRAAVKTHVIDMLSLEQKVPLAIMAIIGTYSVQRVGGLSPKGVGISRVEAYKWVGKSVI